MEERWDASSDGPMTSRRSIFKRLLGALVGGSAVKAAEPTYAVGIETVWSNTCKAKALAWLKYRRSSPLRLTQEQEDWIVAAALERFEVRDSTANVPP
jgi:hypothetical protein